MKKTAVIVLSVILAGGGAWAFQWRYDTVTTPGERINSYQVTKAEKNIRTNRWTGEAQILTGRGWVPMAEADPLSAAFAGLR